LPQGEGGRRLKIFYTRKEIGSTAAPSKCNIKEDGKREPWRTKAPKGGVGENRIGR